MKNLRIRTLMTIGSVRQIEARLQNVEQKKVKQMRIVDNFEQCGKDNFMKLALSALDL